MLTTVTLNRFAGVLEYPRLLEELGALPLIEQTGEARGEKACAEKQE